MSEVSIMHDKPLSESAGEFTSSDYSSRPCPKCGGRVKVSVWESSDGAYEDLKFACEKCAHTWWVDGPDA